MSFPLYTVYKITVFSGVLKNARAVKVVWKAYNSLDNLTFFHSEFSIVYNAIVTIVTMQLFCPLCVLNCLQCLQCKGSKVVWKVDDSLDNSISPIQVSDN